MKHLFIFLTLILAHNINQAQDQILSEKMKPFKAWIGEWHGESTMRTGPGPAQKSMVKEIVQTKLEGSILQFEGTGKVVDNQTKEEMIVHNALGIVSYDLETQQYKIQSYLSDGRSTQGWFTIVDPQNFQWGFEGSWGKMRYTITINPEKKTWVEIGEYSRDGSTWIKTLDMSLTKN